MFYIYLFLELLRWFRGKESACQSRRPRRCGFDPWVGKIPWRRKWQLTPIFLTRKVMDRGAWQATVHRGCKELDTTEWLSTQRHTCLGAYGIGMDLLLQFVTQVKYPKNNIKIWDFSVKWLLYAQINRSSFLSPNVNCWLIINAYVFAYSSTTFSASPLDSLDPICWKLKSILFNKVKSSFRQTTSTNKWAQMTSIIVLIRDCLLSKNKSANTCTNMLLR